MNKLLHKQIGLYLSQFGHDEKLKPFLRAVEETYNQYEKELLASKEKIASANKAKDEFLANMSHELRTPLNAILGYSEMLSDEINETGNLEAMKDDIQKIHNAGKHLLAMIEEILVLTRIESGKLELNISKFQIKPFLEEVTLASQRWIADKKNTFAIEVAEDVDTIETDEEKLRQIILNFLSNAGKFTEKGSVSLSVSLCQKEEQSWVAFHVSDTGRGISPENLQNIFEYFNHIEKNVTRLEGGAGIGLATSKKYCQALGGEIVAKSTPGAGSAFTILLPRDFRASQTSQVYHYKGMESR